MIDKGKWASLFVITGIGFVLVMIPVYPSLNRMYNIDDVIAEHPIIAGIVLLLIVTVLTSVIYEGAAEIVESWVNMANKRKKLTFCFSMLSLLGFCFLISVRGGYAFNDSHLGDSLAFWFWFSVPLIIQIIYNIIFREGDTPKPDLPLST